jgi:predicted nucleic acid-binding protein
MAILTASLSSEHLLTLADSMILATARAFLATLWMLDEDFSRLDAKEYVAKAW